VRDKIALSFEDMGEQQVKNIARPVRAFVDDAISVLEQGPPHWRSDPNIRFWLAMSYALAGRKEQAAAEFAAFRALAPNYTVANARRNLPCRVEPKFFRSHRRAVG
jgi:hypothetical protein